MPRGRETDTMGGDGLWLRLLPGAGGDGTVDLQARVRSGAFSGQGSDEFDVETLRGFASALTAFPLGAEARRGIVAASWQVSDRGRREQVHVALSAYPINSRGELGVRVRVATRANTHDRPEATHVAEVELTTGYSAPGRFAEQLTSLLDGRVEEASLLPD
ncbi:hypothetical protein [Corallococcus coralloides]|nr:hypothetical protein [Corallococcus coralloides]